MIVHDYVEAKHCNKCKKYHNVGREWTDTQPGPMGISRAWVVFLCEQCLVKAGHEVTLALD
jgi:hypothetical protein